MSGIKSFLGEATIYGIGSVMSRLFAFFLIPIYINNLGNELYANITLILLIFTLITFFLALNSGVFFYYYEYKGNRIKQSVFTTWIAYQVLGFCFFSILLYALYPTISVFFDSSVDSDSLRIAFAYMVLSLLPYIVNNTYFNKCRIDRTPSKAVFSVISEAALLFLLIVLFVNTYHFGIEGVFMAQLLSRSLVAIFILVSGFWRTFNFNLISLKLMIRMVSYTWPFFLISSFFWIINSIDKFIGTQLLASHVEVAYLVLAGQITLPIAVFVDVVRQAYGPYVMSIRKNADANTTYSTIFSLIIFSGVLVGVGVITISPFLINILANDSFYPALSVIPYFAIAATINLAIGQFGLGLNLTKNNIYIAIGFITGGIVGVTSNFYLQESIGITGAGISQIVSYTISASIIYFFSRWKMKIEYDFGWCSIVFVILILTAVVSNSLEQITGTVSQFHYLIVGGTAFIVLLVTGYYKYQSVKRIRPNA